MKNSLILCLERCARARLCILFHSATRDENYLLGLECSGARRDCATKVYERGVHHEFSYYDYRICQCIIQKPEVNRCVSTAII